MHCHGNDILVKYAIIYLKLTFLEIPLVKKVKWKNKILDILKQEIIPEIDTWNSLTENVPNTRYSQIESEPGARNSLYANEVYIFFFFQEFGVISNSRLISTCQTVGKLSQEYAHCILQSSIRGLVLNALSSNLTNLNWWGYFNCHTQPGS